MNPNPAAPKSGLTPAPAPATPAPAPATPAPARPPDTGTEWVVPPPAKSVPFRMCMPAWLPGSQIPQFIATGWCGIGWFCSPHPFPPPPHHSRSCVDLCGCLVGMLPAYPLTPTGEKCLKSGPIEPGHRCGSDDPCWRRSTGPCMCHVPACQSGMSVASSHVTPRTTSGDTLLTLYPSPMLVVRPAIYSGPDTAGAPT